jgi:hypothetical protein
MAVRKPLVIIGGQPQELPSGDTLPGSFTESYVVGMTNGNAGSIVRGAPVYVSGADEVDLAKADASGTRRVLGLVADASIAASAVGNVQSDGVVTATTAEWDAVTGQTGGLTPGALYYLSADTEGELTTTPPSGAGEYIHVIGHALSTTELDLQIDKVGYLLS